MIPNFETAVISDAKIRDYLLSTSHPFGRDKAAFFRQFGFSRDAWPRLALALIHHAEENEVISEEDSPFGVRYTVEGRLETPDGRNPMVRVVWFVRQGEQIPRLVTAYPTPRRTS